MRSQHQRSMWLYSVVLPLLLGVAGYTLHRHLTTPYPAVVYSLKPAAPLVLNELLYESALHRSSLLSGPETIAVRPVDSSLWVGNYDGSLVRLTTDEGFEAQLISYAGWAAVNVSEAADSINVTAVCSVGPISHWLCGRPLGLSFRSNDELIVADGYHGLLSYSISADTWQSLWNDSSRDTNSVAIDSGGDVIYFTSASALYRNHEVLLDISSGQCTGSVWRYSYSTRTADLLHDRLCFANGLLVFNQQLIVAESSSGRIVSYSVDGSNAVNVVIDSGRLPCLPDNLHWDRRSTSHYYWVGCGSPIRMAGKFSLFDTMGALPVSLTHARTLVY